MKTYRPAKRIDILVDESACEDRTRYAPIGLSFQRVVIPKWHTG
jgi:hypothetical protein